jgi:hypothetical protein
MLNCWICTKFAKWLVSVDRNVFESWHKDTLQVEYYSHQQAFMKIQGTIVELFAFLMRPFGRTDGDSCSIEVNFVPSNGMVLLYLSGHTIK